MKTPARGQTGSALISIIIVVPFLILITVVYLQLSVASLNIARKDQGQTYSQFSTDGGLDYSLEQINLNNAWTGTGGEVTLQNENNVRTTLQVTVTDNSATSKTITSVGRT